MNCYYDGHHYCFIEIDKIFLVGVPWHPACSFSLVANRVDELIFYTLKDDGWNVNRKFSFQACSGADG